MSRPPTPQEVAASGEPDKVETVVTLDVPAGQSPVRLDHYLTEKLANTTRSRVQRGIKHGDVTVNGIVKTKPSWPVQPGDRIVATVMRPPPLELVPEDIPLNVVYEDDALIVVDKPAGMVVHPAFGHRSGTLVNALLHHVGAGTMRAQDFEGDDDGVGLATSAAGPRYEGDPTARPGLVHRLDKETTGLMVVAKTDHAASELGKQFQDRTTRREYVALVWGSPAPEGRVETWLGRDPRNRKNMAVRPEGEGKWAATNYWIEEDLGHLAVARFKLETGRTHQIRVHAKHIGHPIFSDATYGGDAIRYGSAAGSRKAFFANLFKACPRQALHARTLGFRHPASGEAMDFERAMPEDMAYVIRRIREVEGGGPVGGGE